jgi:hypothetical protein
MKTDEAIMAFSQSEKIKAGLIWISQTIEILGGVPETEKRGCERMIHALLSMVGHEIGLARSLAPHEIWDEIDASVNRAEIMVNSGVGHEATLHLSRALSKVTTIGQQSMTALQEMKLL